MSDSVWGNQAPSTVWDFDEDIPAPAHAKVGGQVHDEGGGSGGFGGLAVMAQLAFSLGRLNDNLEAMQAKRDRSSRSIPQDYPLQGAGAYPAAGTLAINLGSPDQGTFWQVRRLIVGGADITTTPAGIAWVFVQGSPPNQNGANPSILQAADFTSGTFPQKAFYGTHEMIIDATEYLWVVITGGTNGTQYVVGGRAEVFDISAKADFVQ